jgi:hypothetical protein
MLGNSDPIVTVLYSELERAPEKTLSGSRLSASIRQAHPDFDPSLSGSRNLRDFIRSRAPRISESPRRAGADLIYVLDGPPRESQADESSEAPHLRPPHAAPRRPYTVGGQDESRGILKMLFGNARNWRTYASPNSPLRLYVRPDFTEIRVLPQRERPQDAPWLEIAPIPAASLLRIAREFVDEVPDLFREQLLRVLDSPKWWIDFFEVCGSLGLKGRWIAFRRRRIADEFISAVTSAELASTQSGVARSAELSPSAILNLAMPIQQPGNVVALDSLRRVAKDVVDRLNEAELRALSLPLGYVVDALRQ